MFSLFTLSHLWHWFYCLFIHYTLPVIPQFLSANGRTTLATTNPLLQSLAGQSRGLSHRDKLLANLMYQCTGEGGRLLGVKGTKYRRFKCISDQG